MGKEFFQGGGGGISIILLIENLEGNNYLILNFAVNNAYLGLALQVAP